MKRTSIISLILVLSLVGCCLVGCLNVQSLKGNPINPYIQWSVLDRVDLTDLVRGLAAGAAAWGFVPGA